MKVKENGIRVALLCSYLRDRQNKSEPDILSREVLQAGRRFYVDGLVDKLLITTVEDLSSPQITYLKSILPDIPDEDLIVSGNTVTTLQELRTFDHLATKHGWDHLVVIGNFAHMPRVRRDMRTLFGIGNVMATFDARVILWDWDTTGESMISKEVSSSREQKSLEFQEKILGTPVIGELIISIAQHSPMLKIALQTWVLEKVVHRIV